MKKKVLPITYFTNDLKFTNDKLKLAIMGRRGYQITETSSNKVLVSFKHDFLDAFEDLTKEAIHYIFKAILYLSLLKCKDTLFEGYDDFNLDDKISIDSGTYKLASQLFKQCSKTSTFDYVTLKDRVFYETFFCKLEACNNKLILTIDTLRKELPQTLLLYFAMPHSSITKELIEFIMTYEIYEHFGFNPPNCIYGECYTDDIYKNKHSYTAKALSPKLLNKIVIGKDLDDYLATRHGKDYNTPAEGLNDYLLKLSGNLKDESCINYWLWKHDEFDRHVDKVLSTHLNEMKPLSTFNK